VARGGSGSSDESAARRRVSLRPRSLFEALVRHEVRFVILGGIAERLLGSPRTTEDFDICPEMSRANLARLAAMLNEVEALCRPEGMEETGFPTAEPWERKQLRRAHEPGPVDHVRKLRHLAAT